MARKPTGNPNGAPPKPVDWAMFEQLCAFQCTQSEIASFFRMTENPLREKVEAHYGETYSEVHKKFAETGKCSLRRYQFVMAKTKPNMAIWLGKQWLKQKDTPDGFEGVAGELKDFVDFLKKKYRIKDSYE